MARVYKVGDRLRVVDPSGDSGVAREGDIVRVTSIEPDYTCLTPLLYTERESDGQRIVMYADRFERVTFQDGDKVRLMVDLGEGFPVGREGILRKSSGSRWPWDFVVGGSEIDCPVYESEVEPTVDPVVEPIESVMETSAVESEKTTDDRLDKIIALLTEIRDNTSRKEIVVSYE